MGIGEKYDTPSKNILSVALNTDDYNTYNKAQLTVPPNQDWQTTCNDSLTGGNQQVDQIWDHVRFVI